jgi:hypothetical protein
MKRTLRLSENELSRLIRRAVREQDEFPLKDTVVSSGAFEEDEIPAECTGENMAGMSQVDMISACIGKVTEKSATLNKTIEALSRLLDQTKSDAQKLATESRRYRSYRRY